MTPEFYWTFVQTPHAGGACDACAVITALCGKVRGNPARRQPLRPGSRGEARAAGERYPLPMAPRLGISLASLEGLEIVVGAVDHVTVLR